MERANTTSTAAVIWQERMEVFTQPGAFFFFFCSERTWQKRDLSDGSSAVVTTNDLTVKSHSRVKSWHLSIQYISLWFGSQAANYIMN